jgi:uncharacterized membrane protein YbhN (UPF0104 family)
VASLGCLVWALRGARLSELGNDLAALNWWWVAVAVASQLSVYVCQALRWSLVLAPVVRDRFMHFVRAVFVGLFASEVLPVRAGEVLRCYLVSRWTGLPFSVSLSSVVIERIFDGLVMWVGLQWALSAMRVPASIAVSNRILGGFVLAGVALLALAFFVRRPQDAPLPPPGWRRRLRILMDDLARIGHSWYLLFGLLQTFPYLLLQVIPVWVLFRGYGFDLPFSAAIGLMLLLRAAAAVPQAPATLGLFQFVTKEFLERGFGLPGDEAARFSLVLWGAVKLPLLASGAVAVAITGARLSELTRAAQEESVEPHQAAH